MSNMIIKNQVRSISLPSRSHPSTSEIDEALNKVKASYITTDSSKSVLMGLIGLEEVYNCTEEFLKSSSTQSVIISSNGSEFMEEMLDGSLRLMDTCSVSRDLVMETHEHVRGVQSYVRRSKASRNQLDADVLIYVRFRKNMRKEAKKLLVSLKNIDVRSTSSSSLLNNDQQDHEDLVASLDTMRQVVSVSVLVLKLFLEFLSRRQSNNKSKFVSILKRKKVHNEEIKNELESLDVDFRSLEHTI